jgi:hypothetical protein
LAFPAEPKRQVPSRIAVAGWREALLRAYDAFRLWRNEDVFGHTFVQ